MKAILLQGTSLASAEYAAEVLAEIQPIHRTESLQLPFYSLTEPSCREG